MALAILLGGFFGLLVAGGVLAVGIVKQARRDQDDINHAFAEARGEKHDPVIGPAPWSSIDMEALVEEGVAVDRSDPYATLTGTSAFVSWSHSTEATDDGDLPSLDDGPATQLAYEPEQSFAPELEKTFVDEPEETFVTEHETTFVTEHEMTFVEEPEETFVAEPAPMLDPEPVASAAAPARIDEERPVVWRAPAESQVIIFVVALRAIADAVEATLTSGGSTQWNGLEDALAHVGGAHDGGGNARRSAIDVGGHDRPALDGTRSRIIRDGRSAPRRTAPPRRHTGPKPITWRAAGR